MFQVTDTWPIKISFVNFFLKHIQEALFDLVLDLGPTMVISCSL